MQQSNILCVARSAGFWLSKESEQIAAKKILLPARPTRWQYVVGMIRCIHATIRYRPKLIIFGTSTKLPVIYNWLRRCGVFRDMKIVTDNQFMHMHSVEFVDRVLVYSEGEKLLFSDKERHKIIPVLWPSKASIPNEPSADEGYILSCGNHLRDHKSVVRAMELVDFPLHVITNYLKDAPLPKNVTLLAPVGLDAYIKLMSRALFIVVPLQRDPRTPHGHCDISTALSLGKVVITTREASVDMYVEEGKNALMVDPGDVEGYAAAISSLLQERDKLAEMQAYAWEHRNRYSYDTYSSKLQEMCNKLI